MALKMRLYKLCRDPCLLSCPHPQSHAEATCVKEIIVSYLLMLCVFHPFLHGNLEFTRWLGLGSSHTEHSADYTAKYTEEQILLFGERKSGGSVNSCLCCSALKLSMALSDAVQCFVEFRKDNYRFSSPFYVEKVANSYFSDAELFVRIF